MRISEPPSARTTCFSGWRSTRLAGPAALLTAGLFFASAVSAEGCTSAEHRRFDFWLGDWRVETPGGDLAGHNRIESVLGGCALREHWRGRGGYNGMSFTTWDPASGQWRQFWTDNHDLTLHLSGGWRDDRMVLEGTRPGSDGGTVSDRISWIPLDDGTVRQHWEQSVDGAEFTTAFDGRYRRADPATR